MLGPACWAVPALRHAPLTGSNRRNRWFLLHDVVAAPWAAPLSNPREARPCSLRCAASAAADAGQPTRFCRCIVEPLRLHNGGFISNSNRRSHPKSPSQPVHGCSAWLGCGSSSFATLVPKLANPCSSRGVRHRACSVKYEETNGKPGPRDRGPGSLRAADQFVPNWSFRGPGTFLRTPSVPDRSSVRYPAPRHGSLEAAGLLDHGKHRPVTGPMQPLGARCPMGTY